MHAMVVTKNGLQFRDVLTPVPGADKVLVCVHAAGLNRAELAMASGHAHGALGGVGPRSGWSGRVR